MGQELEDGRDIGTLGRLMKKERSFGKVQGIFAEVGNTVCSGCPAV